MPSDNEDATHSVTIIKKSSIANEGHSWFLDILSLNYCHICERIFVAGWPDWKVQDGKLVEGSTPTNYFTLEAVFCRKCQSKKNQEFHGWVEWNLPLRVRRYIGDFDRTIQLDLDEQGEEFSFLKERMFQFFELTEKRGLVYLKEEEFADVGNYDLHLVAEDRSRKFVKIVTARCDGCKKTFYKCLCESLDESVMS
jgi:hypothetical protein